MAKGYTGVFIRIRTWKPHVRTDSRGEKHQEPGGAHAAIYKLMPLEPAKVDPTSWWQAVRAKDGSPYRFNANLAMDLVDERNYIVDTSVEGYVPLSPEPTAVERRFANLAFLTHSVEFVIVETETDDGSVQRQYERGRDAPTKNYAFTSRHRGQRFFPTVGKGSIDSRFMDYRERRKTAEEIQRHEQEIQQMEAAKRLQPQRVTRLCPISWR